MKRKHFIKAFLCLSIIGILAGVASSKGVSAADSKDHGLSFANENVFYRAEEKYDTDVITFEADIYFPEGFSGTGGTMMGSYGSEAGFNYEINSAGNPVLYARISPVTTYTFNNVNVYEHNGEQVHVTIVKDHANKKAHCYINGELKQTVSYTHAAHISVAETVIGTDQQFNAHRPCFKGSIRSIRLYSDVRTATEVAADYNGNTSTDNLLASYSFTSTTNAEIVKDSGSRGYDLQRIEVLVDEAPVIDDYDYSFSVVGDPQVLVEEWFGMHNLHKVYDYILDNAETKKTKFCITLGDYQTWNGTAAWKETAEQLHRLDGIIPYSIIRGNHDESALFNQYFPWSFYSKTYSGSYNGTMNNTYQELTVGDLDYLIVNLDWIPSDYVLEWASEVIAAHPYHNVIVNTHYYLNSEAQFPYNTSGGDTNYGGDIWDKLIRKHANIVMVLCGHVSTAEIEVRQDIGDHGNTVTSMLINIQDQDAYSNAGTGGVGGVATFYFSEGGSKLQVEYYSTVKDKWYMNTNQFTVNLDVVERNNADGTDDETDDGIDEGTQNSGSAVNVGEVVNSNTTGNKGNSKPTETDEGDKDINDKETQGKDDSDKKENDENESDSDEKTQNDTQTNADGMGVVGKLLLWMIPVLLSCGGVALVLAVAKKRTADSDNGK